MGQRLAFIGEEKHDIAGLGLRLAPREPQAHAVDAVGVLAALQGVPRPAPAELFLRSTLDRRDLEMVTPSRALISPIRRVSVQLGRSATGGVFQMEHAGVAVARTGLAPFSEHGVGLSESPRTSQPSRTTSRI